MLLAVRRAVSLNVSLAAQVLQLCSLSDEQFCSRVDVKDDFLGSTNSFRSIAQRWLVEQMCLGTTDEKNMEKSCRTLLIYGLTMRRRAPGTEVRPPPPPLLCFNIIIQSASRLFIYINGAEREQAAGSCCSLLSLSSLLITACSLPSSRHPVWGYYSPLACLLTGMHWNVNSLPC